MHWEAKRRGWSIARVYVDDDLSAFDTRKPRPEYQRLLSDIQLGLRDGVMIWRLDRLHRQPRELEEFIVLCDKQHVALATVTGDVDLATSQGRLLARAWGAFAAHECDVRIERQMRANLERARTGIMGGRQRPYGYKDDGRTVIQAEASVIQEAAGRMLRGESLRSIRTDFNRRRIPTARRTLWQGSVFSKTLSNPRLAGWSTYRWSVRQRLGPVTGQGKQFVGGDDLQLGQRGRDTGHHLLDHPHEVPTQVPDEVHVEQVGGVFDGDARDHAAPAAWSVTSTARSKRAVPSRPSNSLRSYNSVR